LLWIRGQGEQREPGEQGEQRQVNLDDGFLAFDIGTSPLTPVGQHLRLHHNAARRPLMAVTPVMPVTPAMPVMPFDYQYDHHPAEVMSVSDRRREVSGQWPWKGMKQRPAYEGPVRVSLLFQPCFLWCHLL
jgi:hypothetical protein